MYPGHTMATHLQGCGANHLNLAALADQRLPLHIGNLQHHLASPSTSPTLKSTTSPNEPWRTNRRPQCNCISCRKPPTQLRHRPPDPLASGTNGNPADMYAPRQKPV